MNGHWIHPNGYKLKWLRNEFWPSKSWPSIYRKAIREFRINEEHPLTYMAQDGCLLQPDRHMAETDLGTIPPPLRGLFPHDEFERSHILHDSGYRYGGLYLAYGLEQPFIFCKMSRAFIDEVLIESIIADGGTRARARTIWLAVRIGGKGFFDE